tara:strand:- start:296 stop:700 length:405 start_codon:yes stop_codon:yes gene_type:complete
MITIFDYINDILFLKKENLSDNIDDDAACNPYLINRWVSMHSPECATVINSTVNWLYPIFDTKHEQYKFLVKILPKYRRSRIYYIKKQKAPKNIVVQPETVELLARNLELSEREVSLYINTGLITLNETRITKS